MLFGPLRGEIGRWLLTAIIFAIAPSRLLADSPGEQLDQLMDESWQFSLREDPLFASFVGDPRYNDRLPDVTPAAYRRRLEKRREFLQRLEKIPREQLGAEQKINYDVFHRKTTDRIAEYAFNAHLMPITNRWGFHTDFAELPKQVPLDDVLDYENYITRLQAFRTWVSQHIELMRAGIAKQIVQPAIVLRDVAESVEPQIVAEPEKSLLFEPFREFPESIPPDDRRRLTEAGKTAIAESVIPGYEDFLTFLKAEYVPAGRTQIAASAMPNGREYYRHRVRKYTTLDRTPEEIHQLGLSEVERITAEMQAVLAEVQFNGNLQQFFEHLRVEPRFYATSADALLKEVSFVLKKMDGKLPELFSVLPRMPYGIRPVPDYIAPRTTTAYYWPPSGDGRRAGFYYVNTYDLKSRPLYEVEALSLHEAVPGHHLQIALQQELDDLPPLRRFAGFTAFVEGWGLYAERLGLEVGFYEDPYSNFGRLSYEMWRACRLVVDTGMHYLGWTRQQAIDFMVQHTALTKLNVVNEVDRYIAWPAQALAYKVGELTIRRLRQEAEEQLGEEFDVREFHDVVLGRGAVPLDVLEQQVRAYIEQAENRAARRSDAAAHERMPRHLEGETGKAP